MDDGLVDRRSHAWVMGLTEQVEIEPTTSRMGDGPSENRIYDFTHRYIES